MRIPNPADRDAHATEGESMKVIAQWSVLRLVTLAPIE